MPEARFSSELPPTSYKNTVLSQADHAIAQSATIEVCLAHNDHHCWNGRSAAIETEWANQWTGIWTNDRLITYANSTPRTLVGGLGPTS